MVQFGGKDPSGVNGSNVLFLWPLNFLSNSATGIQVTNLFGYNSLLRIRRGDGSDGAILSVDNIGVGTLSPEEELTVAGNILASTSGNVDLILRSSTTNGASNNDDAKFTFRAGSASERFDIINGAGTKLVTIASSGNVGIGTTAPSLGLTMIGGDTASTFRILEIHNNFSVGADLYTHADAGFRGPVLNLKRSRGSQTSPTAVQAGDALAYIQMTGHDGSSYSLGAQILPVAAENWTTSAHGTNLTFWTNSVGTLSVIQRMVLNANGLGIGTTTPTTKLDVIGAASVSANFEVGGTASISSNVYLTGLGTVTDDRSVCANAASGELEFVDGACGTSSARFKENVRPLDYGLDTLMALRPVLFNYKNGSGPGRLDDRIGLIAEELNEIIPEAVKYGADGQPEGIDYPNLIAVNIKAIQQLNLKIEDMHNELAVSQSNGLASSSSGLVTLDSGALFDLGILFGAMLKQFAKVFNIVFEQGLMKIGRIVADSVESRKGVTTLDEQTGEPFCIRVSGGQLVATPGECGTSSIPLPVTAPEPTSEPTPESETLDSVTEGTNEPEPTPSPPTITEGDLGAPTESVGAEPSESPSPSATPSPTSEPTPEPQPEADGPPTESPTAAPTSEVPAASSE